MHAPTSKKSTTKERKLFSHSIRTSLWAAQKTWSIQERFKIRRLELAKTTLTTRDWPLWVWGPGTQWPSEPRGQTLSWRTKGTWSRETGKTASSPQSRCQTVTTRREQTSEASNLQATAVRSTPWGPSTASAAIKTLARITSWLWVGALSIWLT